MAFSLGVEHWLLLIAVMLLVVGFLSGMAAARIFCQRVHVRRIVPEIVHLTREGQKYHVYSDCQKQLKPFAVCLHCQKKHSLELMSKKVL